MANTFEDQAQERFTKSGAFLGKAQTLLQDDLIARTVLADAVSAIKNMLQGYLLIRISRAQPDTLTQQWQEVAASNRMPELIRACDDAGLNIRDLGRAIRQLNDQRNYRTHDDPQSRIQVEQARQALDLARTVAQRVNSGIKANAVPVPRPTPTPGAKVGIGNNSAPASMPRPAVATSASSVRPAASAPASAAPATASVATATSAPSKAAEIADEVEDDGQATQDDTTVIPAMRAGAMRASGGRRVARVALRVGALAAVLAVGVVAGFGGAVAIHADGGPSFLGFARPWLGTSSSTALTDLPASASATSVTTVSQTAGALTTSPPTCAGGALSFTLSNGSGTAALPWAVESANGAILDFGLTPATMSNAEATGIMPPSANITVYVTGPQSASPYQIEAFSPGGTIQLVAPPCH